MIAIIDYGMGNLASVQKAFRYIGFDTIITDDKNRISEASHLVLPGVGAAADAMSLLNITGLDEVIERHTEAGRPFLGICLGMQLILEESFENGRHKCLGLIPGSIEPFSNIIPEYRIPHMGWNTLEMKDSLLFSGLKPGSHMYFVHSFYADDVPEEYIIGKTEYGIEFISAVQNENIMGVQFHPEKSGAEGLQILKNFGGM